MTPTEALNELVSLQRDGDREATHGRADEILCELLTEMGYAEIVEAYRKVPKWYA